MSIQDRKITNFTKPVSGMPDSPSEAGMTAQETKENFDANSNQLKDALNGLIDDLTPSVEGEDAVFHATYGQTTCAELEKAFQDKKSIICSDVGGTKWSTAGVRISPTVFIFSIFDDSSLVPSGSGTQLTVLQNNGDIWTRRTFILPSNENVRQKIENATSGLATTDYVQAGLAAKQDVLTFDSTPTQDSANPVTSGGVYAGLATKQDVLTFDTTPTEGSANPVTSGGVYAALAEAGEDNVFIATYNQTTEEDINNAYSFLEKLPVAKYGPHTYTGYSKVGSKHNFYTVRGTVATPVFENVSCNAEDIWSRESTALAVKASPAFTGTPTAPTAAAGTNTTQIATTEFVQNAVSGMHNMSTDGDWTIRKQSDGFFEAWYTKTETTANIRNQNGALYESDKLTIALPSGISPVDFSKLHVQLNVSETQFAAWSNIYSVSANGIEYSVMSTTSRGIQSHYRVGIYIAGYTS